jgi:hypothetical protein
VFGQPGRGPVPLLAGRRRWQIDAAGVLQVQPSRGSAVRFDLMGFRFAGAMLTPFPAPCFGSSLGLPPKCGENTFDEAHPDI